MVNRPLTSAAAAIALLGALAIALAAVADENAQLVVNGEIETITRTAAPDHVPFDETRSGWTFRTDETQVLQMDDFETPAMIFVDAAREAWDTVECDAGQSCASCHGAPEDSMVGVRAICPRWNAAAGEVRTRAMQINDCRETQMGAAPYKNDSVPMACMEALI